MPEYINSRPRYDGFHMPGEFERHAGCWMLWPERPDNWRLSGGPAQLAFSQVANTIACYEPVTVCACSAQFLQARTLLDPKVRLMLLESNDAWMRDVGPTFIINNKGEVRAIDWDFNGWGGDLYPSWELDSQIAGKVIDITGKGGYHTPGFVLEGGSITVDGQGTLITTEECLLNPNRNPHLDQSQIEQNLNNFLDIQKIIWLPYGLFNDETNGHVDNLCCFVQPGVIALAWSDDPADYHYDRTHAAYERLVKATDAAGRKFVIHKIHLPGPQMISRAESAGIHQILGTKHRRVGDFMPASYINFYLANGGVIVPTFNDRCDKPALQAIHELFPGRAIHGIYSREILLGGGNIHCITLHQPAGNAY